jgi:hypothetical protein
MLREEERNIIENAGAYILVGGLGLAAVGRIYYSLFAMQAPPSESQIPKPVVATPSAETLITDVKRTRSVTSPLTRASLLRDRPDAFVTLLSCSKASRDAEGNAIPLRAYADPDVGTLLRQTPDPTGKPIPPAFPKSEVLSINDVLKVIFPKNRDDEGGTEYWAMNAREQEEARQVSRGARPHFAFLATEKNSDPRTRQIILSIQPGDLDKCVPVDQTTSKP